MSKILHLFTVDLRHHGLRLKCQGQAKALSGAGETKSLFYVFSSSDSLFTKILKLIFFDIKASYCALFASIIYARYSPKCVLLNVTLWILSWFKVIYLEHNIRSKELRLLKRWFEWGILECSLFALLRSPCKQVSIGEDIRDFLLKKGASQKSITLIHNGYDAIDLPAYPQESPILNKVKALQKRFPNQKWGVLVDIGKAWSGLTHVQTLSHHYPQVSWLIVGHFPQKKSEGAIHYLGALDPYELHPIYALCDFGVAAFAPDIIPDMTRNSSLKVREYLCYGLPVLLNYPDPLLENAALSPFLLPLDPSLQNFAGFLHQAFNHTLIKQVARKELSLERALAEILVDIRKQLQGSFPE